MESELGITFRGMERSATLEQCVREKAAGLEKFFQPIISCHVVIERSNHRHHQGNIFEITILVGIPGNDVIVSHEPGTDHRHEDVYVALHDAFDKARRRLQDQVRRLRGITKHHEMPPHGRITKLHPDQDYGFLEASDGHEVYFHRNSVINGNFDTLQVGDEVRFSEEMGEAGPRASSLSIVGKHHPVDQM